jgi:hypothetical protein
MTAQLNTELKSFRKDWSRWSVAEKLCAVTFLILVAALIGAPVTVALL